jgi:hypothetical protein
VGRSCKVAVVPAPRLLLRFAPLVGALAGAVWLRRRQLERMRLPAPPTLPEIEPTPSPAPPPTASEGSDAERIDIVTVVDDLLAGR